MKCWVLTGENRYKWVCMGADGCVGSQGARGIQKQGKRGVFRVAQVRIWVLWPGKFPRTSCFWRFGEKCKKRVRMGADRLGWVQYGVRTRGGAKTRKKEQKTGEQDMFLDVYTQRENTVSRQGLSW